jgi:uncharacterized protein
VKVNLSSTVLAPADFVYQWHTREGAFKRLTPPWENVELVNKVNDFEHLEATIKVKKFGLPITWTAQHYDVVPGRQFKDRQLKGPFKCWNHDHVFEPLAKDRTKMTDSINWELPLHAFTYMLHGYAIQKDVFSMLEYRHRLLVHDLNLLHRLPMEPQVIAITGSNGLVGRNLIPFLTAAGHKVKHVVRKSKPDWSYECCWNPHTGELDDISDVTIFIHLAGESIAAPIRWSTQKKTSIYQSRVHATKVLVENILNVPHNIHTFICASATGVYPDSNDIMTEESDLGSSFLADVVTEWEAACSPLKQTMRVCNARFGAILHPNGGMIKRLKPLMKVGGLGPIGSGKQYFSWIALDDALRAIYFMCANTELCGPVNVVSPTPQLQSNWIKEWATYANRPAIAKLPEKVVQRVMGDMGNELLLKSSRIIPKKLKEVGFRFQCETMTETADFYAL